MNDRGVLKSASALAGGIARRGETCGALIGAILAIGQLAGREALGDREQYQKAMRLCGEAYLEFRKEIGHTLCAEIHKILYGKWFRLYDQQEYDAFLAAGGHAPDGCPSVCARAARIAASMILDLKNSAGT